MKEGNHMMVFVDKMGCWRTKYCWCREGK